MNSWSMEAQPTSWCTDLVRWAKQTARILATGLCFVAGFAGYAWALIWLGAPAWSIAVTHSGPWWALVFFSVLILAFLYAPAVIIVAWIRERGAPDSQRERCFLERMFLWIGILEALLAPIIWVVTALWYALLGVH
jgi:hypothetical protein